MSNCFCLETMEQQADRFFDPSELETVTRAAVICEDLVNSYYKLSSSQWLKNRYDIRTARDLAPHELVDGPFAQVVKYEGQKPMYRWGPAGSVCIRSAFRIRPLSEPLLRIRPFN